MCIGMFMAILDVQVVATSLSTIQGALDIQADQISWIQTAYLIAEIIAIPLTGILTRMLTMRWLFVAAVSVFTLASIGCATSHGFADLITWRVVQGFSGGTLIPAVFSGVFLLFPIKHQNVATTLAGITAVLAPTLGPVVGGWVTTTYSWHWLFLINVVPGALAALIASQTLPREKANFNEARTLDVLSLVMMALALTALEIALKEAPDRGWLSGFVLSLLFLFVVGAAGFVHRTLSASPPIVDLTSFADRNFTIGCILSFALGIGLFGSVYLIPVFLGFVRSKSALDIGEIMLVTGVAQLIMAPIAVALEPRMDARVLTALGFALFAAGLAASGWQSPRSDFEDLFLPQVLRGCAIMFCLLPPTRLALGQLAAARVPDASGLFNLMRNVGGAIGIALIDSVIYSRAPSLGQELTNRLIGGDAVTATFVGIPPGLVEGANNGQIDPGTLSLLQPLVEKAAMTQAINESWLVIAALTGIAILCIPFARKIQSAKI